VDKVANVHVTVNTAGSAVCDSWLSLDYTVSNASVANLLLISFDRYMCVTRPLKYRVRRTPRCAVAMIVVAWVISALLWTPWIVAWPFIDVSVVIIVITFVVMRRSMSASVIFSAVMKLTMQTVADVEYHPYTMCL